MIIIEPRVKQLLIENALILSGRVLRFLFGRKEHDGTRLVVDILVVDNSEGW